MTDHGTQARQQMARNLDEVLTAAMSADVTPINPVAAAWHQSRAAHPSQQEEQS